MSDGALSRDEIDALLAGVDARSINNSKSSNKIFEPLSRKEINQLLTAINADDSNEAMIEVRTEATIEAFKKLSEWRKNTVEH